MVSGGIAPRDQLSPKIPSEDRFIRGSFPSARTKILLPPESVRHFLIEAFQTQRRQTNYSLPQVTTPPNKKCANDHIAHWVLVARHTVIDTNTASPVL